MSKATILVVDDTPANLQLLNEILTTQDYDVRPAPSAALALRSLKHNKPDLILLDINMPRMNGLEFLAEIRADKTLKDSVVFVLTTSKADEDRIAAFNHNVAGYMVKSHLEEGFISALGLMEHYWRIVELPS